MDILIELLKHRPASNWQWLFNANAIDLNCRDNALSFANASLLTYCDMPDIAQQLKQRGFVDVFHCVEQTHKQDTQAFVATREDMILIAFRGTEPTNIKDLYTDIQVPQASFAVHYADMQPWGKVHVGFAKAGKNVIAQIEAVLAKLPSLPIYLCGHSLGGALAVLAAAVLQQRNRPIKAVFTYGQPRVGDPSFAGKYSAVLGDRTFRYVNDKDLIAQVPPLKANLLRLLDLNLTPFYLVSSFVDKYVHVGQLCFLRADGGLSHDPQEEANAALSLPRDFFTLRRLRHFHRLPVPGPWSLLIDDAMTNPDIGYVERIAALP